MIQSLVSNIMSINSDPQDSEAALRRRIAGFSLGLAVLIALILIPVFPEHVPASEGQVAKETLHSPVNAIFQSEILTRQKQEEAKAATEPVLKYTEETARSQLNTISNITSRITQVRDDANLSLTQKSRALGDLGETELSAQGILAALNLPNEEWQVVSQESQRVLQEIMGQRLTSTAMADLSNNLRSHVSSPLSEDGLLLFDELVRPLLTPNLVADEEATQRARDAAAAAVGPETVSLTSGQVIVNRGDVVDALDMESLRASGVFESGLKADASASVILVAIMASIIFGLYFYIFRPKEMMTVKRLFLLVLLLAGWTLAARVFLATVLPDSDRHFLAYLLPIAAPSMVITALLSTPISVAVAVMLSFFAAYAGFYAPDVQNSALSSSQMSFQMVTTFLVSSLVGIYFVHRAERLNHYLTAGIAMSVSAFLVLFAFRFLDPNRELVDIPWMLFSTAIGGGLSTALAMSGAIFLATVFGITTRLQLMELSQLRQPLLQRLQQEAPGTFHHSMIVGSLAERAASLIGADSLTVQVGAYYHDIGKLSQPSFYIENIADGVSPHDLLPPQESAQRIVDHVHNGLALARSHKLPGAIARFIPEHHGTRLVTYFYRKAKEENPSIDPSLFAYEGPKPQSRETAIVMLADSTEAVVRSNDDRSPETIDMLVDRVMAERLAESQLDQCDLTLRDLRTIAESFKASLRAIYHQRIQYPPSSDFEERQTEAAAQVLRVPSAPMDGTAPPQ